MTDDNRNAYRPPSCTFMDIAKRLGADYGDVLLAAEVYRNAATVSEAYLALGQAAILRLPTRVQREIMIAVECL